MSVNNSLFVLKIEQYISLLKKKKERIMLTDKEDEILQLDLPLIFEKMKPFLSQLKEENREIYDVYVENSKSLLDKTEKGLFKDLSGEWQGLIMILNQFLQFYKNNHKDKLFFNFDTFQNWMNEIDEFEKDFTETNNLVKLEHIIECIEMINQNIYVPQFNNITLLPEFVEQYKKTEEDTMMVGEDDYLSAPLRKIKTSIASLRYIVNYFIGQNIEFEVSPSESVTNMIHIDSEKDSDFFKKICLYVCCADDTHQLNFTDCLHNLQQMIDIPGKKRDIQTIYSYKTTLDDFKDKVVRYQPDIVHFLGHGAMIFESGKGWLDKNVDYVNIENFLKMLNYKIYCFILSSCDSYNFGKKLAEFIPYVIGTKSDISIQETAEFIKGFYRSLVLNNDIEISYRQAICELSEEKKKQIYLINNSNNPNIYRFGNNLSKKDVESNHQNDQGYLDDLKRYGQIYENKGDHDSAIKEFKKALNLSKKNGNSSEELQILKSLGQVYENKGDHDSAIKELKKALNLSKKNGNSSEELQILKSLGQVYENKGDHDVALEYIRKSLEIRNSTQNKK